jgi:hypothetical protein
VPGAASPGKVVSGLAGSNVRQSTMVHAKSICRASITCWFSCPNLSGSDQPLRTATPHAHVFGRPACALAARYDMCACAYAQAQRAPGTHVNELLVEQLPHGTHNVFPQLPRVCDHGLPGDNIPPAHVVVPAFAVAVAQAIIFPVSTIVCGSSRSIATSSVMPLSSTTLAASAWTASAGMESSATQTPRRGDRAHQAAGRPRGQVSPTLCDKHLRAGSTASFCGSSWRLERLRRAKSLQLASGQPAGRTAPAPAPTPHGLHERRRRSPPLFRCSVLPHSQRHGARRRVSALQRRRRRARSSERGAVAGACAAIRPPTPTSNSRAADAQSISIYSSGDATVQRAHSRGWMKSRSVYRECRRGRRLKKDHKQDNKRRNESCGPGRRPTGSGCRAYPPSPPCSPTHAG